MHRGIIATLLHVETVLAVAVPLVVSARHHNRVVAIAAQLVGARPVSAEATTFDIFIRLIKVPAAPPVVMVLVQMGRALTHGYSAILNDFISDTCERITNK
jgi:hypothetical protein